MIVREYEANKDTWQLPSAISEKPEIDLVDQYYLQAYQMITSSRQNGMSVNPVMLGEIESYINMFGAPFDDVEAFVTIIKGTDNAWLASYYKDQEVKSKQKPKK